MEAIFKNLQQCLAKTDAKFLAWCKGIAHNKVIDQRRKRRPSQDFTTLDMKEIERSFQASMQLSPPSAAERRDLESLMNLLKRSKPKCYEWLWLHFFDEIEIVELAILLRVEYNTMLRRIQRCLIAIREFL
jgi:DNA-directed RNA polymerase specialized sigma24 family protein